MKILCVDFDGVIHSYTSGWKGACEIPDDPVPGALEWLEDMCSNGEYQIAIYSSRSKEPGAVDAMKEWLKDWAWKKVGGEIENAFDADSIVFPTQKPPAYLTIDDRAICFRGTFPSVLELDSFQPWTKGRQIESVAKAMDGRPIDELSNEDLGVVLGAAAHPGSKGVHVETHDQTGGVTVGVVNPAGGGIVELPVADEEPVNALELNAESLETMEVDIPLLWDNIAVDFEQDRDMETDKNWTLVTVRNVYGEPMVSARVEPIDYRDNVIRLASAKDAEGLVKYLREYGDG